MCQGHLHNFLAELPKCEHHLHLEGCLSPDLVFAMAKKNNIPLPDPKKNPAYSSPDALKKRYEHFDNLQDFLDCHYLAMSVLIETVDFETLAWHYFTNAHRDGVHHAEVFFDPQSHTVRGIPFETVLSGYSKACRRAEKEFHMSTSLIMCFLRHLPVSSADETYAQATNGGHFASGNITGIGLDSSEIGFPPELFKSVFQSAEAKGIHRTAHAGEEGPPSYIRGALDVLRTERIDHGVRLREDPDLIDRVAREGILLTICPLSNVFLQVVQNVGQLPLREYMDAGVRFSINSDDPAYFGGFILNNYCAVQEAFNFSIGDWQKIAQASVEASWVTKERKGELLEAIRCCVEKYEGAAWEKLHINIVLGHDTSRA